MRHAGWLARVGAMVVLFGVLPVQMVAAAEEAISARAQAAYDAGLAALRARNFREAVDAMDEVLDEQRDHPEANYFTGMAYAYLDENRRAERHLERAILARTSFVEAREWLAIVRLRRGDRDDARAELDRLRELRAGCTENLCDDVYMERADRAIGRVAEALGVDVVPGDAN